ncbi:hypothetical protein [Thioclava sp.]|uniref:hypothetical protein n=1 Tax=Thioclava sp. TaxID=1933450 RepID=UPI003AA8D02E
MAISKELFLAILSMDSYNRGYGAGISDGGKDDPDGLGEVKGTSAVGSATVSYTIADADLTDEAQTASFYAIAYTLTEDAGSSVEGIAPGTTILSYRGTDNPTLNASDDSGGSDITNGWVLRPTPDNPLPAARGARVCRKTSCAGV